VRNYGIDEVAAATAAVESRSPEEVAADETYWREIQFAFTLDRSLINLNNGNSCPSPTVVHEAYKRYLDSSNQAPVYHRGLLQRFEKAITPQTRVLHFCHITNQSGQLFPVRDLSRLARQRGITTIVDGAHAMGHFPFKLRDLEMDFYGVSLHKWLLAPTGTG